MLRISQQAAGRIKVPGGTASAIIDLAGSTDDPPAGPVLVAHAIAGAGPGGLSHIEFGPAAPEGSQYDLSCPDCPARATRLEAPPGRVSAVYVVSHAPGCPGLRAARRRAAR